MDITRELFDDGSEYNQCVGEIGHQFVELEDKDLCYIDEETAKSLELLQNNVDSANRKHSLMGYLNTHTATTSGARLIRESLMRPLCHAATIEHRLDCIEYLINRVDILNNIANGIKRFGQNVDLDALVPTLINLFKSRASTLQMAERRLDAIAIVESIASQVCVLVCALESADQSMLNIYKQALDDPAFSQIQNDIFGVIEPEVRSSKGKKGRIFRIKQGVEALFDIARSTYQAALSDMEQYVRDLHKEDGLPWKLSYTESRGYYLSLLTEQMPKNSILGERYIRVNKTRTVITCSTIDLMQCNVRASVSYENSMKLANEVLVNTLASIINHISSLQKLVDVVGLLDLITSFAKLVNYSKGALVRPTFTLTDTIITKSRHPILETVLNMNDMMITPNDVLLSTGHKNFMLISGPNMGGKSVFLKQVALIQIMAQIGCYVPAQSAEIKLMNRIVARCGSGDDNKSNCSSFMNEMRGISSALQDDKVSMYPNALFVIDEVGRGTSIDDGASYSFAIAEELALQKNCFTVFSTHFDQVFTLTVLYSNILAYHFQYEEKPTSSQGAPGLTLNHSLVPGFPEKSHYGLSLAKALSVPDEIIKLAEKDLIV